MATFYDKIKTLSEKKGSWSKEEQKKEIKRRIKEKAKEGIRDVLIGRIVCVKGRVLEFTYMEEIMEELEKEGFEVVKSYVYGGELRYWIKW